MWLCKLREIGITIKHIINNAKKNKINKVDIIVGFKSYLIKKKLKRIKNIRFIHNKFYKSKEMMYSFYLSLKNSNEDIKDQDLE